MSIVKAIVLNFSTGTKNVLNCPISINIPFLVHKLRVVNQYVILQRPDCGIILYSDMLERSGSPLTLLKEGIQQNSITHYFTQPKHMNGSYNFTVDMNNSTLQNNLFEVILEVEFYSYFTLYETMVPKQSKSIVWRVGAGDISKSNKEIDIEFPVDEIIIQQSVHNENPIDLYMYYRGFYTDMLNSFTPDKNNVVGTNISPLGHFSQMRLGCTSNPIVYTYTTGQLIRGNYKIWTVEYDNTPIVNIDSCFFLTFNSYK